MQWYNMNHEPISDPLEIEALLADLAARRIAVTYIDTDVRVSTIFLVLDHGYGMTEAPLLYESMVWGGPHDCYGQRYPTREAALAGHDRIEAWLRDPNMDPDAGP